MPSAGFEPAVPAIERPKTYSLDRIATARPRPTALLPPRSNDKPEAAATAVVELLIMDTRMPETC